MKKHGSPKSEDFRNVQQRILRDSPAIRGLWARSAPKRAVAMALARVRKQAGKSQRDIADITGWDKAFVSRLESALGAQPTTQTITRFVEACNAKVGLVVYTSPGKGQVHVVEAMPLNQTAGTTTSKLFSDLRDLDIAVGARDKG
jgi:transcriptional regulator with XRE-family HTH domain